LFRNGQAGAATAPHRQSGHRGGRWRNRRGGGGRFTTFTWWSRARS